MNSSSRGPRARRPAVAVLATALVVLGAGCDLGAPVGRLSTPLPPTQAPVAPAAAGAGAAPTSPPLATTPLTLWTVAELERATGGPAARAAAWAEEIGDLEVIVSERPGRGETGMLAFLDVQARVLPERLPDVAVLPLDAVAEAQGSGSLRPLPPELAALAQTAWPFARDAVTVDGRTWAVPLAVDLALLAGRPEALEATTWDALLVRSALLVPVDADAPGALSAALTLYAGQGGDPAALPELDATILERWLALLAAGAADDRLVPVDDPLAALAAAEAGAALVAAGLLAARPAAAAAWTGVPGRDGPAPPVVAGWALVLPAVPRDSATALGAERLAEAIADRGHAAWTLEAGLLPAYDTALEASLATRDEAVPGALVDLIQGQLAAARVPASLGLRGPRWPEAVAAALDGRPDESIRLLRAP